MLIDCASRNTMPSRGAAGWGVYLATVSALGLAVVGWAVNELSSHDYVAMGAAFALTFTLVVLTEARPLLLAGMPDTNGVAITTTFVFAALIHWGLAAAVVLQAAATVVGERLSHKAWWRTIFNVAQYALSWAAAGAVLRLTGHVATPVSPHAFTAMMLLPVVVAGAAYFLVNDVLVACAIALRIKTSLWFSMADDFVYQAVSNAALLLLAPFVLLALDVSVWAPLLLLAPGFALYKNAAVSLEKEHASLHDALTGLPNRKSLLDGAGLALDEARRQQEGVALFLLDLDRFKEVNDTLGHHTGDRLLRAVASRLADVVRPGDTVARLGGDEFAVLLPHLPNADTAYDVARRISGAVREPFVVDDMRFDLEASIGVALYPDHAGDFEALLRRADVAMYLAKEIGAGIQTYDPEQDHHSTQRLGMLGELRRAIDEGELELHYQPKADLATGDVVGVEALVRWRHPERGLLPPDQFLPFAEQSGLMRPLTDAVVEAAVRQVATWRAQGLAVPVAVNVSVRDLHDAAFSEHLRRCCEVWQVRPSWLQLEITESVLLRDPQRAAKVLRELAEMGVSLSLDDFGTGYSSLAHLKRLPVSEIKIDRSFVMRMDADGDDGAIVRSIIDLGDALGKRVVAEGIETEQAWSTLAEMGCSTGQGYYLARPMPGPQATDWLAAAAATGHLDAALTPLLA